jgi:hypothetical protein
MLVLVEIQKPSFGKVLYICFSGERLETKLQIIQGKMGRSGKKSIRKDNTPSFQRAIICSHKIPISSE